VKKPVSKFAFQMQPAALHPGRSAKASHPAHLGGHKPSLDIAGRLSGPVGANFYWHNHRVSQSFYNHARMKEMEKGHAGTSLHRHAANKAGPAKPGGQKENSKAGPKEKKGR
jgi:hypothetical protein